MRPIHIAGATRIRKPPADWSLRVHGPRCDLAIRDIQYDEGDRTFNHMTSAWEAAPEELGWILAGGAVHFGTPGASHPAITIEGQMPPEDGPAVIIARPFHRDGEEYVRAEIYQPARSDPPMPAAWSWHEETLRDNGLAMTTAVAIEACLASLAKMNKTA